MKKFRFLLLFLSVLTVAACSNDDNPAVAGIVGKWNANSYHLDGEFGGGSLVADGVEMSSISVTFKEDGTFVSDGDQFTVKTTISFDGQSNMGEFTNDNPFNSGTWEKDGDILRVKNDGEPEVYDYHIDALTSNKLEISLDDYKIQEDGIEGTFNAKMGFKR